MPRALRRGHLGGPDVEAAVDLARVGRDDLGRHAPAIERSATASERPVLPVAVAPAMTRSGGRPARGRSRPGERARAARTARRARSRDGDKRPDQRPPAPSRWTSLFSRVRPARCDTVGDGAVWRPPRSRPLVVVVVAPRRHDASTRTSTVAPEPGLVALEPDPLLELEQLVQAAPLLGRRHVVGELRRRRPGPGEKAAAKTWS